MGDKESTYLEKYRELAALSSEIDATIARLRRICKSLDDWRKTAQDIGEMGSEDWSTNNLNTLALETLRRLLHQYFGHNRDLHGQWSRLKPPERVGLADPESLRTP